MASGDKLIFLTPMFCIYPFNITAMVSTDLREWIFPDWPDCYLDTPSEMPAIYGGGSIRCSIRWHASSTGGNVQWSVGLARMPRHSTALPSYRLSTLIAPCQPLAQAVSVSDIVLPGAAHMKKIAPGEGVMFRLARLGADPDDTMVGDAHVVSVLLEEI